MILTKNSEVFVYLISDDIYVHISHGVMIRTYTTRRFKNYTIDTVILGTGTLMRLLTYLLEHANKDVIYYPDIMSSVWDNNGLVSSYKRLSQVIIELKSKLVEIGLPANFIQIIRGQGYRIEEKMIKPLSFRKEKCELRKVCVDPTPSSYFN